MKNRFRMVKRGDRGATFYAFDTIAKSWTSLRTQERGEAQRLIQAKNDACQQSSLNLQLARVYIQESDPAAASRTWRDVMDEFRERSGKQSTKERKVRAIESKAFDLIRDRKIIETTPDELRTVIKNG